MTATAHLTEGPVAGTLAKLSAPMLAGLFSLIAFNLADTYFVSQLGTRELAAMSFTFPVAIAMFGIAMGLGTAMTSSVSRAIGGGDAQGIRRLVTDGLMLAFVTVLVCAGVGMATIDPLFAAMGAEPDVLPLVREYMLIWYPGMVFLVIPMVCNASIRATGNTRFPALLMIISTGLNCLLDPILIFGLLGAPRLELKGAAIATVIARAITLLASLAIVHFKQRLLDLSRPRMGDVLNSWRQLARIAVPATATNIMQPLSIGIVTRMVAIHGADAVAAWGAGSRIAAFVLIPVFATCSGLVPFIGQNWGAERFDRVRLARRYAYRFVFVWGLAMLVVLSAAAEPIAHIFSADAGVVDRLVLYLWILPIGFAMVGVFSVAEETMNAIGKPLAASLQTLIHMFGFYLPLAAAGSTWLGLHRVVHRARRGRYPRRRDGGGYGALTLPPLRKGRARYRFLTRVCNFATRFKVILLAFSRLMFSPFSTISSSRPCM